MIIGHGDIASVLVNGLRPADDQYIFFASGVSNSTETEAKEFTREVELLMKQDRSKHLVYFSTLSVFYGNSEYVQHKKFMENLVRSNFKAHTIIRIGNITWGNNPHTIINALRLKTKLNRSFEIRDEYRYIVDKDEFLHWIEMIPEWNCEMNIPGKRMKVKEVVKEYVYA